MIVFPVVATGVSAVFAAVLYRRFATRRRSSLLAWAIALTMFAIASATVIIGVGTRWDASLYRVFWLFGVMLNVPWLALGSILLIGNRAVRAISTVALIVASVYAAVLVALGSPDRATLRAEDGIPRGSEIWAEADATLGIGRWYSVVGWLIVVAIAVWTSRSHRGMRPPPERVRGNWLIAVGVTIVAAGGFALSRIGRGEAFSVTLALGVAVMFVGFMMTGRAPRYQVEEPGESPT
jgi:hypothetical protein